MSIDSEISADVCTFHISSPIYIVLYGYPENDYLNPNLKAIMDIMGIYIDAEKLLDFFFEQKSGEGDTWVIGNHQNNCMVLNLYADPHDQMDVISFGVICKKEHGSHIYDLMNAMKEETQKKLRFDSYDITEKTGRLSAVLAGEKIYSTGTFTQKIRYAESFADFCTRNNI